MNISSGNSSDLVLVGDIGGTKTLLSIYTSGELIQTKHFDSQAYPNFSALLREFLTSFPQPMEIRRAVFGVPGFVQEQANGQVATLVNLPWTVETQILQRTFSLTYIKLVNNFH